MRRGREKKKRQEQVAQWRRNVVEGRLNGEAVVKGMPEDWMDDCSDDDD